jgi:hypothetical protein
MSVKGKIFSIVAAGMLVLGSVTGVAAGNSSSASVSVQVEGGGTGDLSITQVTAGAFTTAATTFDAGGTSTGTITVSFEDNRFTRQGWQLTIGAQDFTGTNDPANVIPASNFSIVSAQVGNRKGDPAPQSSASNVSMSQDGVVLVSAPKGKGSGQYVVTVNGALVIPANMTVDTYATTLTFSLVTAP